jgi:eukaryotic-like serine/threonine-protein kinase
VTLRPDETLGPYRITGTLGTGRMGEVYLARDTRLDRDVAVKALPAEFMANPERLKHGSAPA